MPTRANHDRAAPRLRAVPHIALSGRGKVFLYGGAGGWHFLVLPKGMAKEIRGAAESLPRGWGSLRIAATIGDTTWQTSVFPEKKTASYLLPVKKEVRDAEGIAAGKTVKFRIAFDV